MLGMIGEALKGHLDLLLLAVLEGGPAHGYAIIETLRQRSGGTFDLPEGTIYPALHRLEADGLLSSAWSEEHGRRKRIYCLTPKGEQALVHRQQEWRKFASAVDSTLSAPSGGLAHA
jgi:PadR family transcriptional regulator, regulatory protein PadR